MTVISFEVRGNDMVMCTQSGIVKTAPTAKQVDGYVEFLNVQWDFSYVYLLDFADNTGVFSGEKMMLKDFIFSAVPPVFSVIDQTYGYNTTKYGGYLTVNGRFCECFIEIYHEGDMVFVAEE